MFFSYSSNIVFTIPLSKLFSKIFFKIISTIGPISIPIIPINLNPVYIAIKVKIGCIPILLLTIFGSKNCLNAITKIYNPKIEKPTDFSLFRNRIILQGIITVPAPNIGKASTNPINNAIISG